MTDWTEGYVADIGYTYGYYNELNPLRARFAMLLKGWAPPRLETACELGFGQGLSVNVHAAAGPCAWWGTDFNPAQAGLAQELARHAGAGAHLFDDAFETFAERQDLPSFDFIGLHGIWSWISNENRRVIVEFLRRKLRVGGVAYISYNTLPGWSSMAPLRHLMTEHAERLSGPGQPMVGRINAALDFTRRFMQTNSSFVQSQPQAQDRFDRLQTQNRHYLAHEYFNRDWHPMYFAQAADLLSAGKLQFAAPAQFLEHMDQLNLTAPQRAFMDEIADPMLKETVRDFMVNQQFRRDYWVKGARALTPAQREQALRQVQVVLVAPAQRVPKEVRSSAGTATMAPHLREFMLDQLADHRPKSLDQLAQAGAPQGVAWGNVLEMVQMLVATGHLDIAQDDAATAKATGAAWRLNAHLIERATQGAEGSTLAAPRTGGGIGFGRFQQMFMGHVAAGVRDPAELAGRVWAVLAQQGQRLVRDGKPIDDEQGNRAELESQAKTFLQDLWPVCRALELLPT